MSKDSDLTAFHSLALPPPIIEAINDLGFERCTPIQGEVLPYSLSDYDVTGQAQTGTGKTAAFLVTILAHQLEFPLERPLPPGATRSLVLAPTRELALQIESDAWDLARYMNVRVVCLVGGIDYDRQRDMLRDGPIDILVATPGRLLDFCGQRLATLRSVEVLVIDEADRMLDMGFIPDVRRIVYQTPKKRERQTMFFSATFNDDVMNLAQQWTLAPVHVAIQPESPAVDTVEQRFWALSRDRKRSTLLALHPYAPAGSHAGIRESARPGATPRGNTSAGRASPARGSPATSHNASAWPPCSASRKVRRI